MSILGSIAGGAASAAAGSLFGRKKSGGQKGGGRAEEFFTDTGLFKAGIDHWKGQDSFTAKATGDLGRLQRESARDAREFNALARTNVGADQARQLGQDFLGGLDQFSPEAIAEQQFNLLFPILQKQFEEDRLGLESRQFGQGRLGSTGGARDFNALLDQQGDQSQKFLFDSFQQGLAAQQQQANLGSQMLQLDPTLRGLFQNLGTGALNQGLGVQNTATNLFQAMSGAAGGGVGGFAPTQVSPGQAFGAGLVNSGIRGMTSGINQLFGPQDPFAAGNNMIGGNINTVGR